MNYFFSRTKRGFTLVEIIIVIAIIGLLTSVILFSVSKARQNTRDKVRKTDLAQAQLAIELYREAHGSYPSECLPDTTAWAGPGPHSASWGRQCDSDYIMGLTPVFTSVLPRDPKSENEDNNGYLYRSNGTDYKLLIHRTVEKGIILKGEPFARCPASCGNSYCSQDSYAVYSSGAECW